MTEIRDYYELRIYRCTPGRLPDLHHRMGYELPPLFARHGINRPLAYWDGYAGAYSPAFVYMLRWDSLDARFEAFERFYTDPDWHAQRDASNVGEHMVERVDLMLLRPSEHWRALKTDGEPEPVGGLHELRLMPLSTRNAVEAQRVLGVIDIPFLQERGAILLGYFQVWYGWKTPHAALLLAWENFEQREAAMLAYNSDPDIAEQRKIERETHGGPLFMASDTSLLRPASYGTPMTNLAPRP